MRKLLSGLVLAASAVAAQAVPQTLHFDDIDGAGVPYVVLFSSYGGLHWGPRWGVVEADGECAGFDCGFKNVKTSGTHVGTNGFDGTGTIKSPDPFQMISVQLGAAWHNNMKISFVGKLAGSTVWSFDRIVGATGPTLTLFPTAVIDSLEVTPDISSAQQVYYAGSGPRMVLDDFTFDAAPSVGPVPEPATWTFLIAGFGLVGAVVRRRTSPKLLAG